MSRPFHFSIVGARILIASCLLLSYRLISFHCFVSFCTRYVHLHTLYIFGSRVIYLVSSGLKFLSTALFWNQWGSSHSSCKLPRLFRFAIFLYSLCSVGVRLFYVHSRVCNFVISVTVFNLRIKWN